MIHDSESIKLQVASASANDWRFSSGASDGSSCHIRRGVFCDEAGICN